MNVRPILFSGPMVRALLDGRKTQTRRVLKNRGRVPEYRGGQGGEHEAGSWGWEDAATGEHIGIVPPHPRDGYDRFYSGPYAPGDLLWVREAWSHTGQGVWTVADAQLALGGSVIYRAEDDQPGVGWFPSIHMPRRFSRLTLHVTDVRVQRVQEISRDDAIAEGLLRGKAGWTFEGCGLVGSPISAYAHLWRSIHGANAWDDDDWVAAITFTVEKANVDDVIARAG